MNGDLKGFILTRQEEKVYKLKKDLYGLNLAHARGIARLIYSFFMENGFKKSPKESTMHYKMQGVEYIMLVSLYVDEIIYIGSSMKLIQKFKEEMRRTFEMTDLGWLHYFLVIEVKQTNKGIFIAQE